MFGIALSEVLILIVTGAAFILIVAASLKTLFGKHRDKP
jgi:hypothetical protein